MRPDQERLVGLINLVHQASLEPDRWPSVLDELVGSIGWSGADLYVLRDEAMVFATYTGISSDAFEENQKDYHNYTDRHRAAIHRLGTAVVLLDRQGRVATMNQAAEEIIIAQGSPLSCMNRRLEQNQVERNRLRRSVNLVSLLYLYESRADSQD